VTGTISADYATGDNVNIVLSATVDGVVVMKELAAFVLDAASGSGGATAEELDAQLSGSHGAGLWGATGGSGAFTISGVVTDLDSVPIQGALVRFVDGISVFEATTADDGSYTLPDMAAATYSVRVVKCGYTHTAETQTVTGDTADMDLLMEPSAIAPSDLPGTTNAWLYAYDGHGAPQASVNHYFRLVTTLQEGTFPLAPMTAVSDADGLVQITLPQNAQVAARREKGEEASFDTGTAGTCDVEAQTGRLYGNR
jgi:hypothetical protein